MKLKIYFYSSLVLSLLAVACSKPNNYSNQSLEIIREFQITTSTNNQNFGINSPAANSRMVFQIFSDTSSVRYDIFMTEANRRGDKVTAVEIHAGNPTTDSGALIATLAGRFGNGSATGVTNLRRSLLDTLLKNNTDLYVLVRTQSEPLGYMRGQINYDIIFSNNVMLYPTTGSTSPTRGYAMIRVTSDSVLYSNINITNDEPGDMVQSAKVVYGFFPTPGADVITLAATPGDFNSFKSMPLSGTQFRAFRDTSLSIVVSSTNNQRKLTAPLR